MTVRANEGETNPARIAHVPSLFLSHARADEWVVHTDDCRLRQSYPLVLDCECGGPLAFSPEGHDAITAELVACTLGHRVRPELRVDRVGRFAHLVNQGVLRLKDGARALMDELATYRYPAR